MLEDVPTPIVYRGVSISLSIEVDPAGGSVFGHADLFANNEFKGRLALGSARCRPEEIRDRLRCFAKSKVDVWALLEPRWGTEVLSVAPPSVRRSESTARRCGAHHRRRSA
ncbi:MAG: hypothetical protein EOP82_07435 [Variovorax sp.]|nr:MAG: hypothetical protein EOP82_07435 [Variovorax sp.]